MENKTAATATTTPIPTLRSQSATTLQPPTPCATSADFDPFANAKPCSPFYVYNHDSPRPSTDLRLKPSYNVSLQDLEAGSDTLTPSISQEKIDGCARLSMSATRRDTATLGGAPGGWRSKLSLTTTTTKCGQHMCKPKEKSWLKRMPARQRLYVKLAIALVIICSMIGIAVGIAVGLKSTVWTGNNQQGAIH